MQSPPLYSGYFLLGQGRHGQRSILGKLQSVCTDGPYAIPDAPGARPPPAGPLAPPPPRCPRELARPPVPTMSASPATASTPLVALPRWPAGEAAHSSRSKQLTQNFGHHHSAAAQPVHP